MEQKIPHAIELRNQTPIQTTQTLPTTPATPDYIHAATSPNTRKAYPGYFIKSRKAMLIVLHASHKNGLCRKLTVGLLKYRSMDKI